ncbi:MAG: hypothetical protein IT186_22635 [Acidobacteria bacterium]|nr:hypothetical protein [Acidobacteriota bacterium]MCG3191082.1 hypothetical protein [Thermoanaerobaculia bacterium]MCK6685375.1 hypothetical protein [Thermoanaerobaculia bacterium]
MRKIARFLALTAAVAGFSFLAAPAAEAQCETMLKKGASIEVVIQYNNGTQSKATATVVERDDTYLVFKVTDGKQTVQMPGALMGDTFMVTNSKTHNVWTGKCTAEGITGISSTKGNQGKLMLSIKK